MKFIQLQISSLSSVVLVLAVALSGGSGTKDGSVVAYYLRLYNAMNSYRALRTIPALKWNRTVTQTAENFAATAASQFKSSSFDSEHWTGCNFYIIPGNAKPPANLVVSTWYQEFSLYDYRNAGYSPDYNNFTQMIWKSSTSVAIGVYSDDNVTAVVAKFYPVGNLLGAYRQNVIPIYVMN